MCAISTRSAVAATSGARRAKRAATAAGAAGAAGGGEEEAITGSPPGDDHASAVQQEQSKRGASRRPARRRRVGADPCGSPMNGARRSERGVINLGLSHSSTIGAQSCKVYRTSDHTRSSTGGIGGRSRPRRPVPADH